MIDTDGNVARRWAARLVAFYASVRSYEDFFDFHGFGNEARKVRRHFLAGNVDAMVGEVTDAMVDALTLSGTADEVHGRLSEYAGLADVLKVSVPMHLVPLEVTRKAQRALLKLGREATEARSRLAGKSRS
jgi:alkanesulfonate monooxygenase SsuD/methylene tetrahydromethanopterin reductase-like flavin-dependent oxidoreductase (luciferase family)